MQKIIDLIAQYTGWLVRDQDKEALLKKINHRLHQLKLNHLENYYQILINNTGESEKEWQYLAMNLTVPESYLFRDIGQISLLENKILPELIEKNKYSKKLKIWSAGCSTGEEPYTIAILLSKIISNLDQWQILILGTDINPQVINKAQIGAFNNWSFRSVDNEIKTKYFHPVGTEWYIKSYLKKMVKFSVGNLMHDQFPNYTSELHDIDLIICRNVFIYFEQDAIAHILKKMYQTLKHSGYLMTGHAEIYGANLGDFHTKLFEESIIYQRSDTMTQPAVNINSYQQIFKWENSQLNPPQKPEICLNPKQDLLLNHSSFPSILKGENIASKPVITLKEIKQLIKQKKYVEAIKKNQQVLEQDQTNFEANYLMAQIYANRGDYHKATYYCNQAIVINSLATDPYYLLAHIAEEQGNIEKAKIFLKRIIYLSESSIYAYWELSSIYEQEGDVNKAKKMLNIALELLNKVSPTTPVDPQGEITAADLTTQIKQILYV
jgi:chemotaxis protein methyltransferase CheR